MVSPLEYRARDVSRAYVFEIEQWLKDVEVQYRYFLAVRTGPFDKKAIFVVR